MTPDNTRFPRVEFEDQVRRRAVLIDHLKQALTLAVVHGEVTDPTELMLVVEEFRDSYPNEIDIDTIVGTALNDLITDGDRLEVEDPTNFDSQVTLLMAQLVTRTHLLASAS